MHVLVWPGASRLCRFLNGFVKQHEPRLYRPDCREKPPLAERGCPIEVAGPVGGIQGTSGVSVVLAAIRLAIRQ